MTSLERDRVPSPRPIAVKEVPLVNRIEEMNVLKEAVYRAVHGEEDDSDEAKTAKSGSHHSHFP